MILKEGRISLRDRNALLFRKKTNFRHINEKKLSGPASIPTVGEAVMRKIDLHKNVVVEFSCKFFLRERMKGWIISNSGENLQKGGRDLIR